MPRIQVIVFLLSAITVSSAYADINSDLITAASKGEVDTVLAMLDKGADINLIGLDNMTALKFSTDKGHTEIVDLLKQYGAEE